MTRSDDKERTPNVELEAFGLLPHRHAPPLPDAAVDDLFARIAETTVDRRPTLRDRLRELPTPARVALSVLLALAVSAAVLASRGVAPSVADAGPGRFALALASVVGFMALAVAVSLRGAHRRSLGLGVWTLALLSLAAPIVLGLLPGIWGGRPAPSAPAHAHDFGLNCFRVGLVGALLTGLVIRVFQREDRPTSWRLIALAATGGLVAFGSSQLYCPSDNLLHVTVGHGLVGATVAAIFLSGAWLIRRIRGT
ncbi:MAG: hypothetical protein R3F39_06075 [Myxococcota bacterium]